MNHEHIHEPYETWLKKAYPLFSVPAYQIDESYDSNMWAGPKPPEREFKSFLQRHGSWRDLPQPKAVSFLNFQLHSELGVAAGPLLDSAWIKRYADLGYAILSYKTVRTQRYPSHRWPNIVRVNAPKQFLPHSLPAALISLPDTKCEGRVTITNSFGMPSADPYGENGWMEDVQLAKSYLSPGQILAVSVVGTPIGEMPLEGVAEDFALCASLAVEAGADIIEANLSCPNVASGEGSLCYSPEAAALVARTIRQYVPKAPLALKLGYFLDLQLLDEVVREVSPSVDILVAINSVKFRVQKPSGQPALDKDRQESGVCGYAIQELGLHNVRELCRLREKEHLTYKVIGCGGVFSVEDVAKYILAGADAVEVATAALWHPLLSIEWNAHKTAIDRA
jgi:dihydroorotate dehydrogenase (NAD+) catalytic subunit